MLSELQRTQVWEGMLSSEIRALYFADLASTYTRRKQLIVGLSFFLSSAAAASLIGKLPQWVPLLSATCVALASAYSMAAGLDRKAATMAKLHSAWFQLASDYERLWSHTADDNAEAQLNEIIRREREPSELASTEAPYDKSLMEHWQEHVERMRHLTEQHV